jgi:hypothetical protein
MAGLVVVLAQFSQSWPRLSDTSYLHSSRHIATTVTQGSFLTKGLAYCHSLWEAEGWFPQCCWLCLSPGFATRAAWASVVYE